MYFVIVSKLKVWQVFGKQIFLFQQSCEHILECGSHFGAALLYSWSNEIGYQ